MSIRSCRAERPLRRFERFQAVICVGFVAGKAQQNRERIRPNPRCHRPPECAGERFSARLNAGSRVFGFGTSAKTGRRTTNSLP